MAGSLGSRQNEARPESWYVAIETAMDALNCTRVSGADGHALRLLTGDKNVAVEGKVTGDAVKEDTRPLPNWLLRNAAPEVRPPRPLAPSMLDDRDLGERPAAATMRHAAERGKLIHGLIERIDGSRIERFADDAANWLAARDRDARHDHAAMIGQVRSLICDRRWQSLFSTAARAEVPIAALIGETVVTGRVDRLLVEEGRVLIVDFKTTRRVPENAGQVNLSELRQMAHYVAAIEAIFPDREVAAALLYTHAPAMIELTGADLAPHKPV
jgi:ATP-dependent helicase/nuclease subunit A